VLLTPFYTLPLIPSHPARGGSQGEFCFPLPLGERIKSKIPPKAGVRVSKGLKLPPKVNLTTVLMLIRIPPVIKESYMRGKNVHIQRIEFLRSPLSPLSTYAWICLSLRVKRE